MPTTPVKSKLFQTRIDIPQEARQEMVTLLNGVLATTTDLYTHTKQAHWNVKGSDFYQLHELFDEIAEEVLECIDDVAERVTALGGLAMGTARLAAEHSILTEYPTEIVGGSDHLRALSERVAAYGRQLRQGIEKATERHDADTADILTDISRTIDKRLWFLEAHFQV
jgi:starvation-inducible DNA-binding protein